MNIHARKILRIIEKYLNENPEQRFTQALFNLRINMFADENNPAAKQHLLRDCYNDTDTEVLNRITWQSNTSARFDTILLMMAAENNEDAKFMFSETETTLT